MKFPAWRDLPLERVAGFLWLCYPAMILTSLSAGQAFGILLAVLWFLLPKGRRGKAWAPGLGLPVAVFYAWILLAALFAQASPRDINDMAGKWAYILLLALAYAQASGGRRIWLMLAILAASAILQYPYFIYSYLYTGYARARALSGGSPNLGTNLMMAVILLIPIFISMRGRAKLILGSGMALLIGALAITLNRAAALGTLAGASWWARRHPIMLAGAFGTVIAFLLAFPESRISMRLQSAISLRRTGTAMERIRMWNGGMRMIRDRPLAGYTSRGRFREQYWSKYRDAFTTEPRPPGHVHNSAIQVAIFHGVPGLGLFFWWLAVIIRHSWRLRNAPRDPEDEHRTLLSRALFPLLLGVLVNAQFDFVVVEGQRAMLFYCLTGLIMGCAHRRAAGLSAA